MFSELVLNVFVEQFDLVALLSDFNAQQIAHREHSYPAIAIDHRQVSTTNHLHSFEGLVGSFVTLNHGAQFARHVSYFDSERIAVWNHNAIQHVAFGENAE